MTSFAALEQQMAGDAEIWRQIAEREGLAEPDLHRLALPWHTDPGRPIEVVTDNWSAMSSGPRALD